MNKIMKKHCAELKKLNPCKDALEWTLQFNSPQEAWDACEKGDWMLWLWGKGKVDKSQPYSEDRKPIVAVAIDCARLAWGHMPQAAKDCIELHQKWVDGEVIPIEQLRKKRNAAAYAADAAAAAAYATYAAAAAYAAAYARKEILKKAADIVRKHHPKAIVLGN
jgi:hypothetical protein